MSPVNGLVMVEGLPGSGKSTTAHGIATWLAGQQVPVEHWAEGRVDHPVDFEQVAVLGTDQLVVMAAELAQESPGTEQLLLGVAERLGDVWVVRHQLHAALPAAVVDRLRAHDAYDGDVKADVHAHVLTESWRRFGREFPGTGSAPVQVWECVLVQNPVCALVARADQSVDVLARHVAGLVEAVRDHAPALVYLDTGDPRAALERAAAERPVEWLDSVIDYHTSQGLGLRCGYEGFDGYVEFMRRRREMELEVLEVLDLPTLVVPVGDGLWDHHTAAIRAFVAEHLGVGGDPSRPGAHQVA